MRPLCACEHCGDRHAYEVSYHLLSLAGAVLIVAAFFASRQSEHTEDALTPLP